MQQNFTNDNLKFIFKSVVSVLILLFIFIIRSVAPKGKQGFLLLCIPFVQWFRFPFTMIFEVI